MKTVHCNNLDECIQGYETRGYRLDMIFPADSPREALMSRKGCAVRLELDPVRGWGPAEMDRPTIADGESSPWAVGRAGMEYRDLVPDRYQGRVIVSHIRLPRGGAVPDNVHYHKTDLQLICCLKGRILVVYQDQGEPFWLEPGDVVLQPPGIRHRVLECEAGSEVVEITMPAEHETWTDYETDLPTSTLDPGKVYGAQRFMRSAAAQAVWSRTSDGTAEIRRTDVARSTGSKYDLEFLRETATGHDLPVSASVARDGTITVELGEGTSLVLRAMP